MNEKLRKKINPFFIIKFILVSILIAVYSYAIYQYELGEQERIRIADEEAFRRQREESLIVAKARQKWEEWQREFERDTVSRRELNERIEALRKKMAQENQKDVSELFDEYLEDFLSDPEDDLAFPTEIFDDNMDEDEHEYIEKELDF